MLCCTKEEKKKIKKPFFSYFLWVQYNLLTSEWILSAPFAFSGGKWKLFSTENRKVEELSQRQTPFGHTNFHFAPTDFLVQSVLTQLEYTNKIIEIPCKLDMQKLNICFKASCHLNLPACVQKPWTSQASCALSSYWAVSGMSHTDCRVSIWLN